MICKKCGQNIADDAEFCGYCGGKIIKSFSEEKINNEKCPQCGCFIENDSLFCGECGYKFASVENNDASSDNNSLPSCFEENANTEFYDDSSKVSDEYDDKFASVENNDASSDNNSLPSCFEENANTEFYDDNSKASDEYDDKFASVENNVVPSTANTSETYEQSSETTTINKIPKQKPSKNNLLIYILLGVMSLVLCCCVFMFINSNSRDQNHKDDTSINMEIDNTSVDNKSKETKNKKDTESNESTDNSKDNDDYLLPTNERYITFDDLEGFSKDEIALIRNEIYARHGYVFKSEPFKSYFSKKEWYVPNPDFSTTELSEIELANKDLIVEYEQEKGWK